MFSEVKCVILTCNICEKNYTNYEDFSIFADQNAAKEDAKNDEWYMDGEKHYCPKCYTIDDEDVYHIKPL